MLLWEKSPDFFYKQQAILYQSNSMFNPNFPKGSAAWRCKRVSGAVGDAVAGEARRGLAAPRGGELSCRGEGRPGQQKMRWLKYMAKISGKS